MPTDFLPLTAQDFQTESNESYYRAVASSYTEVHPESKCELIDIGEGKKGCIWCGSRLSTEFIQTHPELKHNFSIPVDEYYKCEYCKLMISNRPIMLLCK